MLIKEWNTSALKISKEACIDAVIRRYGFENEITVKFAEACEHIDNINLLNRVFVFIY